MADTPVRAGKTGPEVRGGARIDRSGFREYDARWTYPDQVNRAGFRILGAALGTLMHETGSGTVISVGHDFREYSPELARSLMEGLTGAGIDVLDIGMVLSPMAYFSRVMLDVPAVAMVTASHNPNGWTGLKAGFRHPLTLGGDEIARLRDLVFSGTFRQGKTGTIGEVRDLRRTYLDDVVGSFRLGRKLRAICATGNGTASIIAPEALARIGVEVVPLHCTLDSTFPNYDPNPESLEMLNDMADATLASGADIAFGFDGDGDRLGVVDDRGEVLYSDKLGVLLARSLASLHPDAGFIADIKSTCAFRTDPVLRSLGACTEYWKTGHSHLKHRLHQTGALAAFEKSGHFYFGPPAGRGYDDGILAAIELCRMLDREPDMQLSAMRKTLPMTWSTPTMSPWCSDRDKYRVMERIGDHLAGMKRSGAMIANRKITEIITVNGARCVLENGSWCLVRASSNTPNLVVVCESVDSEEEMVRIFRDLDAAIRSISEIGPYDQQV